MNEETDARPEAAATRDVSRRRVIRGAAAGGLALPLLAACGSGDGSSSGSSGSTGSTGSSGSGGATVGTSDVPVGGGKILAAEKVVVTQPIKGQFKAFSGVCTHQGCLVQTITDGAIVCPCHGSSFSVEDGSVVTGPATQPLESLPVTVKGDQVTVS